MYMAPEQARGETLDHRADLFSLGSVLYTMCYRPAAVPGADHAAVLKRVAEDTPRPIREIIPETPQWLCDLIARLHAKKPEDRFATAREVADLLERRLAEMQRPGSVPNLARTKPPAQAIPEAAPAMRRPRFRIRRWAAAAAVLLVLLGGLGVTEATGVTDVHGTVIRLFSPEGTLVVEVDDPGVSVKIDGSDIVITGAGAKEIRLKPGNYKVEASKDGKIVRRELVTVTTNGRQVVRVSQEAPPKSIATPTNDPDRRAAEHVLSIGGVVQVNGRGLDIKAAANLPPEPFRLTAISFYFFGNVLDEAPGRTQGLHQPPDFPDTGRYTGDRRGPSRPQGFQEPVAPRSAGNPDERRGSGLLQGLQEPGLPRPAQQQERDGRGSSVLPRLQELVDS